jgi:hypothetical protein
MVNKVNISWITRHNGSEFKGKRLERWVPQELKEAKALADYWGFAVYQLIWKCADLKSWVILLRCAEQTLKYDRREDIENLERLISETQTKLAIARDKLKDSQASLSNIKSTYTITQSTNRTNKPRHSEQATNPKIIS